MKRKRSVKKRLFISNLVMVLSPFLSVFFLSPLIRLVIRILNKTMGLPILRENRIDFGEYAYIFFILWISMLVLVMIIVFIVNRFLTRVMVKHIINPLEILSNGVRQIRDNNLGFRLDYQEDDEFRPVCEVFNEMAAQLEAMIAERQKDEESRRELIAGISHDLRTPLTSIKAYLEGIETGVASNREQQENYFSTIKNKTNDLEHIINQLFLFSKLDLNDFPLNFKILDAGPLVADMIMELSDEYAKRGLAVELGEITRNIFVNIDPILFRTVIINVLENSAKYKNSDQGRLTVSCLPVQKGIPVSKDGIEIRLTDDGPGVSKEVLEKLFDVFYRADLSRNTTGNGLGLAISQKIVNHMDGLIRAEPGSLPAGRGLSIVIYLPAANGTSP
jgi:signal transduction histidine kinase